MGENDLNLEDLLVTDDTSSDNLSYSELTAIVSENVTEEEDDALRSLLNKKEFPVQEYADKYGITRQAANQRIVKLKKKLQRIIAERYLEIA